MNLSLSPSILESPGSLHREMPWISLPLSAEVPHPRSVIREPERRRLLHEILECERALGTAETFLRRREAREDAEVDPREVRSGWRKFFLAHSAFFHVFGLLADRYRRCTAVLEHGRVPVHEIEQ